MKYLTAMAGSTIEGGLDKDARRMIVPGSRLSRLRALTLVVSMSLLTMAGVASAKSAKYSTTHPKAAIAVEAAAVAQARVDLRR